jgi:uncharacterized delta-60 repeat protein
MPQSTVGGGRVQLIAIRMGLSASGCRSWGLGFVMAVLQGLSWSSVGLGAPGDLDPTFGTGGVSVTFGPQDTAHAIIQQADGKLVVAGTSAGDGRNHVMVVRYQTDGRVDTASGPGGKVIITVGGSSGANALALQPDGKLLVAGFFNASPEACGSCGVLLVRYGPEGDLDPSFGNDGVTADFGDAVGAKALVLQLDGKFVVASSSPGQILLARYQPDGRLDATFGAGGKVVTTIGGFMSTNVEMVLQQDGKLVLGGVPSSSGTLPSWPPHS